MAVTSPLGEETKQAPGHRKRQAPATIMTHFTRCSSRKNPVSLLLFFFLAFFLLPPSSAAAAAAEELNDDVLGLILFKAEIQDPRSELAAWTEDDERPCGWPGVECDPRTGRVTSLTLDGRSLSGRVSARGLLRLTSLRSLSLAGNQFSGALPPSLLRIPTLRSLSLDGNDLSGAIPDGFFSQCGSLRSLSLAGNRFSGPIPSNILLCSSLTSLNFSHNVFTGTVPDLMRSLRSVSLSGNRLSGQLPEDIGDSSLLRAIDFSDNLLSGPLPESMRKLSLCNELMLASNSFSGEVPLWIGEMGRLKILDLSSNAFSGEVPDSVGNLSMLEELNLSGNSLNGSFPAVFAGHGSLTTIDFSRNSFSGTVPQWVFTMKLQKLLLSENKLSGTLEIPKLIGNAGSSLRVMDLSGNAFSSAIPDEISGFTNLQVLNLSSNWLSGSIPASISDWILLEAIDLSMNQLNRSIPVEIGKCTALAFLDLSKNYLSGPIPLTIANLTNLESINLSFNKLAGVLPKKLSDLPHLMSFNVSNNFLSGDLPSGKFFNSIPASSLTNNPGLCGTILNITCQTVLPKPIVLNPNSSSVASSDPALVPDNLRHKKIILSISALIAICAAALITVGVIAITFLNLRVRSSTSRSAAALALSEDYLSESRTSDAYSGKLVMFSGNDSEFSTGTHAVLNKDCELGRGGFGAVYKAILRDGRPVTIKKLTVSSLVKNQQDFEREVKKLGKASHRNLVALQGYYWTSSLQLLISEFVSGGSLHKRLHSSSKAGTLSWRERIDVILGTARGLAHLHKLDIIHYNLKSSNVLLDGGNEAKVCDYGLAKLLPMLDRYVLSTKIQSSLGYMAPEFACKTVKITEKCDVYAFGVLVLEVVSGRRPVEYMEDDVVVLCDVARRAAEDGRVEECIDGRLRGEFPAEDAVMVVKLALVCTLQVPSKRPGMAEVVSMLELIRCPEEEVGIS